MELVLKREGEGSRHWRELVRLERRWPGKCFNEEAFNYRKVVC
jgi:hypothetical protein